MIADPRLQSLWQEGIAAHRRGDFHVARSAYRGVLAMQPDHPPAWHLLGLVHLQEGEPHEAVEAMERAAKALANDAEFNGHLAQAYFALARYADAQQAFRRAARLDPRTARYPLGAANAMALQKNFAQAHALLHKLAARFPRDALVWFNLGNVERDLGRADDALASYRKALALDPALADARNNAAGVLYALERFSEAEREYRELIAHAPDHPLAPVNLASLLIDLGRASEAEAWCRGVAARHPGFVKAHTLLGAALGHQGRLNESLECYRTAARLAPEDAQLAGTITGTLLDTGRLREGLPAIVRSLAQTPDPAARMTLAGALLRHGRLREGWAAYRERGAAIHAREKYGAQRFAQALPARLDGARLTVQREQGLGDEIFFLRYAPLLAAAGARVTYRTGAQLHAMLARSPAFARILDDREPLPAPDAEDAALLAGDLPRVWGEREAQRVGAPPPPPFDAMAAAIAADPRGDDVLAPQVPPPLALAPTAERAAIWRQRLAALGPPPYLGVTWRAGTPPREQRGAAWMMSKEIAPSALAQILRQVPGTLIALQRKPVAGEIEALAAACGRPLHDLTALNDDLEDMLAVLSLIDDYLAVSNTNVHLRASAGRTSRVLVPAPPEWRWMAAGDASPWFPGTPVYRQTLDGDWGIALAALARDLA